MNTDLKTRIKSACLIRGNPWLLLGDAVDRAHAPDEGFAVDWDDSARGEKLLEGFHGAGVIRMSEHRSEHNAVGDVKVCVTGRQAFEIAGAGACAAYHAGHWQSDDLKRVS